MLIRFVVNNFLSFDNETEFNMLAGSSRTHKHHVYNAGKVDVLKASAIYGANGAGKSNLIKAIDFLQNSVSAGKISKSINPKKFKLNEVNKSSPISFEIEFSINKKIYSYGISFNNLIVTEEWLYESGVTTDDKMIFERQYNKDGKSIIKLAKKYSKTQKQKLLIELMEENLLKSNELFLGKSEELKIDIIHLVKEKIEKKIILIYPGAKFHSLVPALTQSSSFKSFANDLLKTFDTGVTELGVETIEFDTFFGDDDEDLKQEISDLVNSGETVSFSSDAGGVIITKEDDNIVVKKAIANHMNCQNQTVAFDLDEESDGTQRLLDFIPAFEGILNDEFTFIIDEIDQSIHPALLKALIRKIMSNDKTKGQLIFTTHESNLLDLELFRQDEIWFIEKDKKSNSSQLYSLSDFKPRYDLDIQKGYLKGRFGAIPFLAKLEDLKW